MKEVIRVELEVRHVDNLKEPSCNLYPLALLFFLSPTFVLSPSLFLSPFFPKLHLPAARRSDLDDGGTATDLSCLCVKVRVHACVTRGIQQSSVAEKTLELKNTSGTDTIHCPLPAHTHTHTHTHTHIHPETSAPRGSRSLWKRTQRKLLCREDQHL